MRKSTRDKVLTKNVLRGTRGENKTRVKERRGRKKKKRQNEKAKSSRKVADLA